MSERLDTLARILVDRRDVKDETERAAKKAKKEYEAAEQDIWNALDDENVTSMNFDLPDIGKVQIQKRQTVRGIVTDKEAAIAALRELGLDEGMLGVEEIRKAPLNEHVRDLLQSGQEFPAGIDYTQKSYVSISRKRGSND